MKGMPASREMDRDEKLQALSLKVIFSTGAALLSVLLLCQVNTACISLFNLSVNQVIYMFISPFYCKVQLRKKK